MSASFQYGEEEPLFSIGQFPVRFITLLVGVHCLAMVAAALLLSAGLGPWLDLFSYNSTEVAHWQIWRLFTYAFVATPDIWFLFQMLMLYYFGKEVENGLGWKRFAILYAGLVLLGPLLLQAFDYAGHPQFAIGAQDVGFAVFAAFVAMHPSAQFFFGLAARWVFVALLAISSLQYMAAHQAPRVLVLVSSCLLSIMLLRRAGFEEPLFGFGFRWELPSFGKKNPKFTATSGGISSAAASKNQSGRTVIPDPEIEMDRLLEKISSKGMGSLSREERDALESARRAILQRSGGER